MTQPKPHFSRRRRFALENRIAQLIRLRQIATGARQPEWPREAFYLKLLQAGDRPDPHDFVLSWALGSLERHGLLGDPREPAGEEEDSAPKPDAALAPDPSACA